MCGGEGGCGGGCRGGGCGGGWGGGGGGGRHGALAVTIWKAKSTHKTGYNMKAFLFGQDKAVSTFSEYFYEKDLPFTKRETGGQIVTRTGGKICELF